MSHTMHRATLALHTPLGTPLAGDTLFGQLCWALREAEGEAALERRLDGYTHGQPWLVVSDGFPADYLPKPTLPALEIFFGPLEDNAAQRKAAKARRWVPATQTGLGLKALLAAAVPDPCPPQRTAQAHNTINRMTGTTGTGEFAPYSLPVTFHLPDHRVDLYLVLDIAKITEDQVRHLLETVGASGFGRDASTGLGKFSVVNWTPAALPAPADAGAWWTLGPCAPQGQGFDPLKSYYRTFTRFGRHGNVHALAGQPFKTPVLLAGTGAVFTPAGTFEPRLFIGQGIGGGDLLSKTQAGTVHQGYAPVLPLAT